MYWIQNRMIEIYDISLVFVEFRLLFYWTAGNILAPEVHWCPALPVQENILVQVHCSRYTLLWRILFLVVKSVGILVSYSMRKPREGLQVSSGSWGDNGTAHSITCNLVVSLCRAVSVLPPSQESTVNGWKNVVAEGHYHMQNLGDVSAVALIQHKLPTCKCSFSQRGLCLDYRVLNVLFLHYQCYLFHTIQLQTYALYLWLGLISACHFGYSTGICAEKHQCTAVCPMAAFESTPSM